MRCRRLLKTDQITHTDHLSARSNGDLCCRLRKLYRTVCYYASMPTGSRSPPCRVGEAMHETACESEEASARVRRNSETCRICIDLLA
jgi:hypothetical protein